jgi:hypothetical protein
MEMQVCKVPPLLVRRALILRLLLLLGCFCSASRRRQRVRCPASSAARRRGVADNMHRCGTVGRPLAQSSDLSTAAWLCLHYCLQGAKCGPLLGRWAGCCSFAACQNVFDNRRTSVPLLPTKESSSTPSCVPQPATANRCFQYNNCTLRSPVIYLSCGPRRWVFNKDGRTPTGT